MQFVRITPLPPHLPQLIAKALLAVLYYAVPFRDKSFYLDFRPQDPSHRISSILDGANTLSTFTYKPLTNNSIYARGNTEDYPNPVITAPLYVVSNLEQELFDGTAITDLSYTYEVARVNSLGLGLLGFEKITIGPMTYTYDALGQLIEQTDNSGNTYTISYDKLGRTTQKTGPEGTYTYTYDAGFLGKQESQAAPNGITHTTHYDALGRPETYTEEIDGVPYTMHYTYNTDGQLQTMIYPNNFGVNYIYDNNGYTTGMTRTDNNEQIWNFGAENRFGQLTAYTLGNNIQMELQYDAVSGLPTRIDNGQNWGMSYDFDVHTGNLNSRAHLYNGLSEDFEYDNLDRLISYNTATKPLAVTYANTGSITFKSDAGRYTNHQPTGRTTSVDHESSASGFEISDVTQSITYTAFNSVESIMEDAYDAFFTYGPDQQRSKMLINHQGSTYIERMYIAGGQYERDRLPDGSWRNLTYISTPAGLSAVFIQNEDTQEEEFYFIHTDYQGSIMALTDYNGQLVEEYSYDPWGNRRDPNTWQTIYTNTTNPSASGGGGTPLWGAGGLRGFTGHEHLDCFALINMNGRMYDPVLGRMLSPDNYTHSGTQGLNRYAYVFNNPLKYTDPSGEFPWLAVMIAVAINTSLQARSGNMNTMLAFGTAIGVGAAAGATGYYTGAYIAGQVGSFGFVPGAIVGATGGGSGGFITGAGNAWSNGSSFGQGLRAGLQSAASGYMFGALIGGSVGLLRAINFGLRPIDGVLEILEADLEYYQYLASVEPGATGITDPGQISWQSSSKADKLRHFLKWIRYANTVEKSGEIRWSSMFDDIDPTTVIVEGGGPSGFDIREFVNVDMSGKVIPTKLSIWGNKPSGRQVHDIIDLPGPHTGKVNGSSLYYGKSSSYRFVTNNWSNLEYALEWLGFWN